MHARSMSPCRLLALLSAAPMAVAPAMARAQAPAAADSTEVLVWYSPTALYFGVRAFEAHGVVRPNLADRDHIDAEDRIEFLLGTAHDGRQAYVFQVNPLGVQADGTLVETAQSAQVAGGGTTLSGRQSPDLSADFVFQSRGHVTPYGYAVEVRIPFKSIRYQSAAVQDWDLNVTRHVRHSGYHDTWAPARRAAASFLAQSGTLAGLTDLRRGLVLDVNPEVTQSTNGVRRADGRWGYGAGRTNVGGNVRRGVTNNLTPDATVRPDFSQIEADAGQLVYDPRNALYYPERRPFFLEGIELFDVPNRLVYTRRIVQPAAAGKLTGTLVGTNLALLTAADDPSTSLTGTGHPLFNILRVQRDAGPGVRVGALVADREDGRDHNRVAGLDTRLLVRDIYSVQAQIATSATTLGGARAHGPLWELRVNRTGRVFGMDYGIRGIDRGFVTQSGFISRPGVVEAHLAHQLTYLAPRGAIVENVTGAVSVIADWQYRAFLRQQDAQDKKLHFDAGASFRGGWTAGVGVYTETFGYDPSLYTTYRLVLPAIGPGAAPDTVPFVGRRRIPNHDYLVRVVTEYDAQHVAPLRDDGRTNAPIVFHDPNTGTYAPSTAFRANQLRLQGFFSYQPMPGTVFFAGYGALLAEPQALRWRGVMRQRDGFFVKLSYLVRAG